MPPFMPRDVDIVSVPDVDVGAIRRKLGMSQTRFGARFGFTIATLRNWEQGRTKPDAGNRTLLLTIAEAPDVVDRVLAAAAAEAAINV